jgi:hypothetical protein
MERRQPHRLVPGRARHNCVRTRRMLVARAPPGSFSGIGVVEGNVEAFRVERVRELAQGVTREPFAGFDEVQPAQRSARMADEPVPTCGRLLARTGWMARVVKVR